MLQEAVLQEAVLTRPTQCFINNFHRVLSRSGADSTRRNSLYTGYTNVTKWPLCVTHAQKCTYLWATAKLFIEVLER